MYSIFGRTDGVLRAIRCLTAPLTRPHVGVHTTLFIKVYVQYLYAPMVSSGPFGVSAVSTVRPLPRDRAFRDQACAERFGIK